jgi:NADPH:quinone reductase-like Zn-dependent oxidoreductase
VQPPSQAAVDARQVRNVLVRTQSQTTTLAELARRIDAGEIQGFVGQTYALSDASKAWENFGAKRTDGKIVIQTRNK